MPISVPSPIPPAIAPTKDKTSEVSETSEVSVANEPGLSPSDHIRARNLVMDDYM